MPTWIGSNLPRKKVLVFNAGYLLIFVFPCGLVWFGNLWDTFASSGMSQACHHSIGTLCTVFFFFLCGGGRTERLGELNTLFHVISIQGSSEMSYMVLVPRSLRIGEMPMLRMNWLRTFGVVARKCAFADNCAAWRLVFGRLTHRFGFKKLLIKKDNLVLSAPKQSVAQIWCRMIQVKHLDSPIIKKVAQKLLALACYVRIKSCRPFGTICTALVHFVFCQVQLKGQLSGRTAPWSKQMVGRSVDLSVKFGSKRCPWRMVFLLFYDVVQKMCVYDHRICYSAILVSCFFLKIQAVDLSRIAVPILKLKMIMICGLPWFTYRAHLTFCKTPKHKG